MTRLLDFSHFCFNSRWWHLRPDQVEFPVLWPPDGLVCGIMSAWSTHLLYEPKHSRPFLHFFVVNLIFSVGTQAGSRIERPKTGTSNNNTCGVCGQPLFSFRNFFGSSRAVVTFKGKNFHADCCKCAVCNEPLHGRVATDSAGAFYHEACAQEKLAPKCDCCKERIPSQVCLTVLPFQPNYRLGHPENYLFSLSKKNIFWIKVSENKIRYFWKRKHWCLTSNVVSADTLVSSQTVSGYFEPHVGKALTSSLICCDRCFCFSWCIG